MKFHFASLQLAVLTVRYRVECLPAMTTVVADESLHIERDLGTDEH